METKTETTPAATIEQRLETLEANMQQAYAAYKELEARTVAIGLCLIALTESPELKHAKSKSVGFVN